MQHNFSLVIFRQGLTAVRAEAKYATHHSGDNDRVSLWKQYQVTARLPSERDAPPPQPPAPHARSCTPHSQLIHLTDLKQSPSIPFHPEERERALRSASTSGKTTADDQRTRSQFLRPPASHRKMAMSNSTPPTMTTHKTPSGHR